MFDSFGYLENERVSTFVFFNPCCCSESELSIIESQTNIVSLLSPCSFSLASYRWGNLALLLVSQAPVLTVSTKYPPDTSISRHFKEMSRFLRAKTRPTWNSTRIRILYIFFLPPRMPGRRAKTTHYCDNTTTRQLPPTLLLTIVEKLHCE